MEKTNSISSIFIKYFIFLVILPIFILIGGFYYIFNYLAYQQVIKNNSIISYNISRKLDDLLVYSIKDYYTIIKLLNNNIDNILIESIFKKYDFVNSIYLINDKYLVYYSMPKSIYDNFDYSYSPYILEAEKSQNIIFSEVYISENSHQQNINVVIPFKNNGKNNFLNIVINVNKLLESISELFQGGDYILLITNEYDALINPNNKLFINSLKKLNLKIKNNVTTYDGKKYITVKDKIPFNNWNIYLLQEMNMVFMSLLFLRVLLFLIFILTLTISFFFFYLNFKHVFEPISHITSITTKVAGGSFNIEKLENLRIKEVKLLHDNFINMVNQLVIREKSLEQNEKKYRDLVEENIDSIIRINSDLNITYLSPSIEKIVGYTNFEFINLIESKERYKLFPDKHLNYVSLYIIRKAFLRNNTGQFIIKCIHRDGYEIYIEIQISPICDENKQVKYIQGIGRDITRRYEAEKRATFFRKYLFNIIDSLPIYLLTLNSDFKIDYYNTASLNLFGNSLAKGKEFWKIIDNFVDYKKYFEIVSSTKMPMDFQDKVIIYGKTLYFKFNIVPLKMDSPMFLLTMTDITDVKYMEKELVQANKFKSISNLVRSLSHDINNILGALSGEITLIEYKIQNNMLDDFEEDIDIIKQATQKGQEIIKKISLIYKLESLENFEMVDINHIIKKVINKYQDTNIYFQEKNYSSISKGNQKMLEELFNNVISYSSLNILNQSDGKIKILIEEVIINNKKNWEIIITDNGELVPQEDFDYIFDPYYKNSKTGKKFGLELAFSYKIAKLHNGTIEFYSHKEIGNKFTIIIPMTEEFEELQIDKKEIVTERKNVKKGEGVILVIDDENIVRYTTSKMLQICGYNILEASNGLEALKRYSEKYNEINCVILDYFMPDSTGYDLFLEMKKINKNVKVILSSSGMKNHPKVKYALENGINYFIQKPYSLEELSNIVFDIITSK